MKIKSVKELKIRRKDALPDIDCDFESTRRDDVKRYIEQKYSLDNVCSIGTYNRMKSKSAIKDMARVEGADFASVNLITKELIEKPTDPLNWGQVFEQAQSNSKIKNFIKKYPRVFKFLKPILMQTRSSSVHPSAVVIVPKKDEEGNDMKIWDWMPVRKDPEKGVIISEWEGKYMDLAGFLKEDILGISQLDKFRYILDLIKKNRGEEIDFSKIPMDDEKTYKYFQKGWNEDVFQFGTGGLKTYCTRVKPNNIEDLIAINALYRPGPMGSGAHEDFVKIREGSKKPAFDKGMKDVTINTAGLYIYQEQVMQGMVVGGLSLVESDETRTAIKKFDKAKLDSFKDKFINGYNKITGNEKESEKVWDKMMAFSSYGFNKSHAAAYSVMGYWSQYFKVHYPLEFWTASLNFCNYEEETPNRISEIIKTKEDISVKPPDINKSEEKIICDPKNKSIYYSLISIKNVGEVASSVIINERRKNGDFYSLEEFLKRVDKSKVNKKVVTNLILAGAFDETCFGFDSQVTDRIHILREYFEIIKQPLPEEFKTKEVRKELFWKVKQKELTGLGKIDYKKAAEDKGVSKNLLRDYTDYSEYIKKPIHNKEIVLGGKVNAFQERMTKPYKGVSKRFLSISFETNSETLNLSVWDDYLKINKNEEKIFNSKQNKSYLLIKVKTYINDKGFVSFSSGDNFKIIEL